MNTRTMNDVAFISSAHRARRISPAAGLGRVHRAAFVLYGLAIASAIVATIAYPATAEAIIATMV